MKKIQKLKNPYSKITLSLNQQQKAQLFSKIVFVIL